jgi:hypothetical protein
MRRTFEPLESRLFLTTTTVNGTTAADTFIIRDLSIGATLRVGVKINTAAETVYTVNASDDLVINGLGGANTFNLLSTAPGIPITLNGGADPDAFTLGDTATNTAPSGAFTINGAGGNDSLEYRDQNTLRPGNPSEAYTITDGLFTHDINDVAPFTQSTVHYHTLESLRIAASQNQTDFYVSTTGAAMILEGGGGNDTYTLGFDTVLGISHLLHLTGGAGNNTVTVNNTAGPASNLHVDALGFGRAPGDNLFPPGGGVIDADMSNIVFNLSDSFTSGDHVYLTPRATTSFNINADLPGSGPNGDSLTLALVGVTGTVWNPITSTIGSYTFANRAQVSYTSVESRTLDNDSPQVLDFNFRVDAPLPALDVQFSEDVAYSLTNATPDFIFTDSVTGIPASSIALVNYDHDTDTATFTFPGFPGGILPDANYSVVFNTGVFADLAGNPSVETFGRVFFAFAADANHNRVVDFNDLVPLAQNYNTTGKTFSEGDFNYDGKVDFNDLVLLAQRYNTTLAPPINAPPILTLKSAPAPKSTMTTSKKLFSTTPVAKPKPAPPPPARKKSPRS